MVSSTSFFVFSSNKSKSGFFKIIYSSYPSTVGVLIFFNSLSFLSNIIINFSEYLKQVSKDVRPLILILQNSALFNVSSNSL